MNKKEVIGIVCVLMICALIAIVGRRLDAASVTHIYDAEGNEIANIYIEEGNFVYQCEDNVRSYVGLVLDELLDIMCSTEHIDKKQAMKKLMHHGLSVVTYFDQDLNKILNESYYSVENAAIVNFSSVLCDTKGCVLASVSMSKESDTINYASYSTYAASVIKPLSVYGPALEDGVIDWSTRYEDAPISVITNDYGETTDWPQNVESYTYEACTVAEALQRSLNTVAVRVLQDYGVLNSIDFLSTKFDINVDEERSVAEQNGNDEVLGNIGLGYLRSGVTVKDMAAYYQVFANGGTYQKARAIQSISRKNEIYYEDQTTPIQVFSTDTAYIMNRMLKLVVEEDGTAPSAYVEGYDICGKTGTSQDNADNWFVGMTPEYVCATWYGGLEEHNYQEHGMAADYFATVIAQLPHNSSICFPEGEHVVSCTICKKTGKVATASCSETITGYFNGEPPKDVCDEH